MEDFCLLSVGHPCLTNNPNICASALLVLVSFSFRSEVTFGGLFHFFNDYRLYSHLSIVTNFSFFPFKLFFPLWSCFVFYWMFSRKSLR